MGRFLQCLGRHRVEKGEAPREQCVHVMKGRVSGSCLMCVGLGEQLSVIRTLDMAE